MGKAPLGTLNFRYRGRMNWLRIYKGMLAFFRDKEYEVLEWTYKDKTNEFEGIIKANRYVDMYSKFEYEIVFKAFDMNPTGTPNVFDGKLMVSIEAVDQENYKIASPAGKKVLFEEDSWIHKMYRKITDRDREENTMGEALVTAQSFVEWLKEQCAMDMHYG